MQRPRRPFQIAFVAICLAIGLPLVVLMFGAIRNRQLQSKSNPRWAQFAKVTGPAATNEPVAEESTRLVIRTASIITESSSERQSAHRASIVDSDLTGSVTGQLSVEPSVTPAVVPKPEDVSRPVIVSQRVVVEPSVANPESVEIHDREVRSENTVHRTKEQMATVTNDEVTPDVPCRTIIHAPIIFRPLEDEVDSIPQPDPETRQLNAQLVEMKQRLDQLAERQQRQHAEELEREAQVRDALTQIREAVKTDAAADRPEPSRVLTPEFAPDDDVAASSTVERPNETKMPAKLLIPADEPEAATKTETPIKTERPVVVREPAAVEAPNSTPAMPRFEPAPQSERIRIKREVGANLTDVFTMEAKDVDIREFFGQLGEVAQVSILPSAEVTGRISLNLHAAPLESALRAILKSRNYVYEREGDIVLISTAEEAARLKQLNRQLSVKIYQPSYLSAAQACRLIEPLMSADGRHSAVTPVHPGLLQADELETDEISQPDTVIVQDTAEVLSQIDRVLVEMDVPPLQVMIEAKIVCVRLTGRWEHGIDLAGLPCQPNATSASSACGLKHANLCCNVPTFIKAVERVAEANVVTSQRIQVLNKHRAEMLIGDRIGYQKRSGESVQFMESGTRLIFRPSISADGCIRLEVHPERSSISVGRRSKVTQQSSTELTTQVLIHDGATAAIAGLISEQSSEPTSHASKLGSIPVVGAHFRRRAETFERTELVVLVTPHVMTDCLLEGNAVNPPQVGHVPASGQSNQAGNSGRQQQARAHLTRASAYLQQGNPVKARQQIDASMRLNNTDPEAHRVRNEIQQCLMRTAAH